MKWNETWSKAKSKARAVKAKAKSVYEKQFRPFFFERESLFTESGEVQDRWILKRHFRLIMIIFMTILWFGFDAWLGPILV